jgi:hypothetical protein
MPLVHHPGRYRAFLAALLLACLLTSAQAAPLTSKDRVKVFEEVWSLIRDRY